jgi:arylsulfatase A-like enzyme/Flp pilus assembly protein TadD
MSAPTIRVIRGAALLAAAPLLFSFACRRAHPTGTLTRAFPSTPDVLLITIDTLRADALGYAGNSQVRTPTLDRLARGGVVFRGAHAHNVVTLPSHANILTGLLPYQHGVRDNTGFRLSHGAPTLASLLKAKGYATAAFVGAFPLDARFGLNWGFDVYDDRYRRGKTSLDFEMPERPAAEVVAAAKAWWDGTAGKPRFLWVHLYDCHAPYRPPQPFAEEYRSYPYLGEVAAVDAALAPLLAPLREGGSPAALILVTADHGEALGDHGEQTHGLFAYEATLHVPLIVWCAPALRPAVRDDAVGHVDIAPTILQAAGVPAPSGWLGSSLLSPPRPSGPMRGYFEAYSAAYNRGWAPLRGVLSEGMKFVDLPIPELYELGSDSSESRNIAQEKPEAALRLARLLPEESRAGAPPAAPPSEEVRALRSLGYLSGQAKLKPRYGPADDPKSLVAVDRDLHACIDLYQRGQLDEATALARKIVRERPTMAIGYENLGFLLRQRGSSPEALAVYRKAVDSGIAGEELIGHYGLALAEAGRGADAIAVLEPLSGTSDPDTLNALGIAYADAGRPADADRAFVRALERDARNVEAYQNLGIVALRAGKTAEAAGRFREALALDDRLPRAWNGLGVALARLGQEREAIAAWTKAIALDPRLYDALFNLGLTAGKNGMRREARGALERFVATAPASQYRADISRARQMLATLAESGS